MTLVTSIKPRGNYVVQITNMPTLRSVKIANLAIGVSSPTAAAEMVCSLAAKGRGARGCDIHLVNAYTVALSWEDPGYKALLQKASCNLPDGKPLALYAKSLDTQSYQVRGPRLFSDVLDRGRNYGVKHFLLGSTPETLQLLEAAIKAKFPGAEVVGSFSPPFRAMTADEVHNQDVLVANSGANLVWVGLGTPKQDFETQRIASALGITAVAVGAAFDFTAGTKKEAPKWVSQVGLEWLFRFAAEPRRLWRRYLLGNVQFLLAVVRHSTLIEKATGTVEGKK